MKYNLEDIEDLTGATFALVKVSIEFPEELAKDKRTLVVVSPVDVELLKDPDFLYLTLCDAGKEMIKELQKVKFHEKGGE